MLLGVVFCRFIRMVRGEILVTLGNMRVVSSLLVRPSFMLFGGFLVVLRRVFMMFSGLFVVFCTFMLSHKNRSPVVIE
jgi:hypothetical protein